MPLGYITTSTEIEGQLAYWSLFQGEVLPIEFTFPDEIDISNDTFKVVVTQISGDIEYSMAVVGQTVSVVLPTADTANYDKGDCLLNIWHVMANTNKQVLITGTLNVK